MEDKIKYDVCGLMLYTELREGSNQKSGAKAVA